MSLVAGWRLTIVVVSVWCFGTASAEAQGWVEMERPAPIGHSRHPVERVSSEVRITVTGRVARVEVEERFRNTGRAVAEGTYLYPLPRDAAFQNLSLWMGDQELRGETMDAEQARAIYEEIVRRRQDPALLTWAGHSLLRAQVFPIQPKETRTIVLRYSHLLPRSGDALHLRYAAGIRAQTAAAAVSIRVTVLDDEAYGTPYSPTHSLETDRRAGLLELTVGANPAEDLELFLPLRRDLAGISVMTHAPDGEDGYFMLVLAPPTAGAGAVVPRDLTLVVDVSGSMSGTKLEQAKAALEQALGTLRPTDRFRLITFSTSVQSYRPGLSPATREHLAQARAFVAGLAAEGGTNIAGALDAALAEPGDDARLAIILFVTDGLPSVGERAPDRIAGNAAAKIGRARLFTVGLGHDVNTYLLDRLAIEGRGAAEYVGPAGSVEIAMGSLVTKLRHPALVDLKIGDAPARLYEMQPTRLPDLFYGEELVVFGRYRGHGRGRLEITGERHGRQERLATTAEFPVRSYRNDYIPRLWAARRIGDLTRQIRLEGATTDLVTQVRELGLRYGIVTEYTAYLVQEPGVAAVPQPTPLDETAAGRGPRTSLQTGREAFERAEASAKLSDVSNLAKEERAAAPRPAARGHGRGESQIQRIRGRVFVRRGSVWTDARYRSATPITAIQAYSPAYFELVRVLPEVTPYLSAGDAVLVAGHRVAIQVSATGKRAWQPGVLAAFVRDFRGT